MSADLADKVLATAQAMNACGINRGSAGNVSARCADGFIITPTGMAYDDCTAADMAKVGADGTASGPRKPSSEWRFHRDIYRTRPEAGAVVHTHSSYATTFACLGRPIPAFHYEVAFAGGRDIRCAPYRTFGTQELSDVALAALEGRKACLLAQHGAIAFGTDLADALRLADKIEHLARIYWQALQVGEPPLLSDGEMDLMAERFRHYGPRPA